MWKSDVLAVLSSNSFSFGSVDKTSRFHTVFEVLQFSRKHEPFFNSFSSELLTSLLNLLAQLLDLVVEAAVVFLLAFYLAHAVHDRRVVAPAELLAD